MPKHTNADSFRADKLRDKSLRISYNYCGVCGHTPQSQNDEPNYAPLRWWDPDDGWKVGTLCRHCHNEVFRDKPKRTDYAYHTTNQVADDVNTDEDPALALE